MTLTLLGDVFLGIFLTMIADRVGRRRILFAGSGLMILSGLVFSYFENFWVLLLAAIVGQSLHSVHAKGCRSRRIHVVVSATSLCRSQHYTSEIAFYECPNLTGLGFHGR